MRESTLFLFVFLVISTVLGNATVAVAGPPGYSVISGELTQIDLATGDVTVLGDLGLFGVGGMTMARSGDLLAISSWSDDLWRIDPRSASATRIGPLGIDASSRAGLTMDACGSLWLATDRVFYEVDPSTGATTRIADLEEEVVGLTSQGVELIGVSAGRLVRIDHGGTMTSFGDPVPSSPALALDLDGNGRLRVVYWYFSVIIPSSVSMIFEFDAATGSLIDVIQAPPLSYPGWNLAIRPPPGGCAAAVAVPVDRSTLAFFGLILACLACWRLGPAWS